MDDIYETFTDAAPFGTVRERTEIANRDSVTPVAEPTIYEYRYDGWTLSYTVGDDHMIVSLRGVFGPDGRFEVDLVRAEAMFDDASDGHWSYVEWE